jgi:hypothetical protein
MVLSGMVFKKYIKSCEKNLTVKETKNILDKFMCQIRINRGFILRPFLNNCLCLEDDLPNEIYNN